MIDQNTYCPHLYKPPLLLVGVTHPRESGGSRLPAHDDAGFTAPNHVGAVLGADRCCGSTTAWPPADVEHYQAVTFPEILRAVATATGRRVLGVAR